jgi:hypothetical protein
MTFRSRGRVTPRSHRRAGSHRRGTQSGSSETPRGNIVFSCRMIERLRSPAEWRDYRLSPVVKIASSVLL